MSEHTHRAIQFLTTDRPFTHCITSTQCAANPERQKAHGGVVRAQVCSCGARMRVEKNGGYANSDGWHKEQASMTKHEQFTQDMEAAGFEVIPDYEGRFFYEGPAVRVAGLLELQEVIRATTVNVRWDDIGKSGLIVYPVSTASVRS